MHRHFIFATNNADKMTEIRAIFEGSGFIVDSLADVGLDFDAEESGATFQENAVLKATAVAAELQKRGLLPPDTGVMADDSGLCVNALNGEPGVYSRRYLGENTVQTEKNLHIINLLKDTHGNDRAASFQCVIACVLPDGRLLTANGAVEGLIATEPRGNNGFGYDPIFYLPEYDKTTAELNPAEKNQISHRGRALAAMMAKL